MLYTEYFIHPNDRKALDALRSLPAFPELCRKFNEYVTERQRKVINLSCKLRLSQTQLPELWNLLPPICEKLEIPVPELYLEQNPMINAYTFGDTNPFICIHSGLLDKCSPEVVRAIIAHECGHIVCHHTLYKSLAHFFLKCGSFLNIPFLTFTLQFALLYWDRCSEYSADRAAAYVSGGSGAVVDAMTELCSGSSEYRLRIERDEMLAQAEEFHDFADASGWNKFLMYYELIGQDHPFTVDRAADIVKWCDSDDYKNLCAGVPYTAQKNGARCPKCGASVDTDANFCAVCGAKIKRCPNCGALSSEEDGFCGNCGGKLL